MAKVSDVKRERIFDMYLAGYSIRHIATTVNLGRSSVFRVLESNKYTDKITTYRDREINRILVDWN